MVESEALSVNSFLFLYYGQPKLLSVQPTMGPMIGGSVVSVRGSGFSVLGILEHENNIICIFRSMEHTISAKASLISSDLIECITPSWTSEEVVFIDISFKVLDFRC